MVLFILEFAREFDCSNICLLTFKFLQMLEAKIKRHWKIVGRINSRRRQGFLSPRWSHCSGVLKVFQWVTKSLVRIESWNPSWTFACFYGDSGSLQEPSLLSTAVCFIKTKWPLKVSFFIWSKIVDVFTLYFRQNIHKSIKNDTCFFLTGRTVIEVSFL